MAAYNGKDRFYKRAKQDHFVARSIYKLEEIDRRFGLLRKGARVVDLGCAPGSWLQYIAASVGDRGLVIGYDVEAAMVHPGPRARWHQADVHELTAEQVLSDVRKVEPGAGNVDALVSDMAPKLSGIRDSDQARSIALAEKALVLAKALVRPGGAFIAKVFQGRDLDDFVKTVRVSFDEVKVLRPEATREGSREAFVVARGFRQNEPLPNPGLSS